VIAAELDGGDDIHQDSDERQRVGVDAEGNGGTDDRPQREHADGSDEPGKCHALL
jgi:hypothetical protein